MSFETNSLRLDVYFKKKQINGKVQKIDRRNIRQKLTPEQILEKKLVTTLLNFGVSKPNSVVEDLKKINNIENLNPNLIVLVYLYFVKKNLDINLVVSDFDNDFNKQLNIISKKNIFPKLETPYQKYLFRQDFIMYLILVISEETEENYEEENYEEENYEEENYEEENYEEENYEEENYYD